MSDSSTASTEPSSSLRQDQHVDHPDGAGRRPARAARRPSPREVAARPPGTRRRGSRPGQAHRATPRSWGILRSRARRPGDRRSHSRRAEASSSPHDRSSAGAGRARAWGVRSEVDGHVGEAELSDEADQERPGVGLGQGDDARVGWQPPRPAWSGRAGRAWRRRRPLPRRCADAVEQAGLARGATRLFSTSTVTSPRVACGNGDGDRVPPPRASDDDVARVEVGEVDRRLDRTLGDEHGVPTLDEGRDAGRCACLCSTMPCSGALAATYWCSSTSFCSMTCLAEVGRGRLERVVESTAACLRAGGSRRSAAPRRRRRESTRCDERGGLGRRRTLAGAR